MSIHKLKSGSYQVRWRVAGRLKAKSFLRKVDADKFEAKQKVGETPQELKKAKDDANSVTFRKFAEIWVNDHAKVHKTESSWIRDIQMIRDYFFPAWEFKKIGTICKRDIVQLQSGLNAENRLAAKTINNIMGLCHKMFHEAVQWEYLEVNPTQGLKSIKVPEQDFRFWTFEERDRFLSWAKANNEDLYRVVAIAVYTGLRRGEMEALNRDCVDFERRQIIIKRSYCHKANKIIEHTKGKKIRRLPMNEIVYRLLRERSLIRTTDQVLPFDYQHIVNRWLTPAQEEAGVSRITFHDLRHTFASHLAMSDISLFKIKELLGHSDIRTTMRYMHLAPSHLTGTTDILMPKSEREDGGERKTTIL